MKNVFKSLAFVLIFAIGLTGLYSIFSWKETSGNYISSITSYEKIKNNDLVDVIFLGPSYTYHIANPAILWENNGIASINMAISGSDFASSVAVLKETLKTQTPEVVCFDASMAIVDTYVVESNLYRNTMALPLSLNNLKLIDTLVEDSNKKKDIALRWPIVHTRYKELQKYDFVDNPYNDYSLGFFYTFTKSELPYYEGMFDVAETIEISDRAKSYVDEIITLSGEYGFEPVFYLPPLGVGNIELKKFNGFGQYVTECGLKFVNFISMIDYLDIDLKTDFSANNHMNYWGSKKIMEYFAGYFNRKFELTDHRGDPAYSAWDKCSYFHKQNVMDYEIMTGADLEYFAENITSNKDMFVVISLAERAEYLSDDKIECLQQMGIRDYEPDCNATWVINGDDVYIIGRDDFMPHHSKVSQNEYMAINRLQSDDVSYLVVKNAKQIYTNEALDKDGLFVFIYDKITEKVICNSWVR